MITQATRMSRPMPWEAPGLARAERGAALLNTGLDLGDASAYHLWNLALGAQRAGDGTAWAQGLLLDGFSDASRIAAKDDALDLADGCLTLWGTAAAAPGTDYGSKGVDLTSSCRTPAYPVTRSIEVTGFSFRLTSNGNYNAVSAPVVLYRNGLSAATAQLSAAISVGSNDLSVTFPPVRFSPGDTLQAGLGKATSGGGTLAANEDRQVCGYFTISSWYGGSGSVTGLSQALSQPLRRALAWVRHSGGTVGVALSGQPMEEIARRQTFTHTGTACLETTLALAAPLEGAITPVLTLHGGGGASTQLYDYGISLI